MAIFFIQELNSKGLYVSSPKKKENRFLGFTSFIKREIGKVLVVVVQWRQRNVQKRVMHVQSCCFANLNLLLFRRSRWCRRRRCLRSLVTLHDKTFFVYCAQHWGLSERFRRIRHSSVCLLSRRRYVLYGEIAFLILSSLSVKALKVFWCDFRLSLFCVQWLNCATDTPTLHIKCG